MESPMWVWALTNAGRITSSESTLVSLDPDDLVVGDDDPAFDRLELRTDQNGPFKVHTRRSPARE